MKKLFTCILSFLLIISFVFPISAFSSNSNNKINGIELSIRRISAKFFGKNEIEIAENILHDIGMREQSIKQIPDDKKIDILEAQEIYFTEEFGKVTDNGVIAPITESVFENAGNIAAPTSVVGNENDGFSIDTSDNLFNKQLVVLKNKSNSNGEYSIIMAYGWKSMSIWRGEDILSVSAENLIFDRSTFEMYVYYLLETYQNHSVTSEEIWESYDTSDYNNNNDLKGFPHAIAVHYNLPNDLNVPLQGTNMQSKYFQLSFMVFVDAEVSDPNNMCKFNVYGNYFHQKVGLGSFCVKVDANGASVSVTPNVLYDKHQIMTPQPLVYKP